MGRRPAADVEENLTYRQVEEFVSGIGKRIPGLKTLKVDVSEDGSVSFEFEVIRVIGGKGKV